MSIDIASQLKVLVEAGKIRPRIHSSLQTNTGARFISLRNDGKALKISIPLPEDTKKKLYISVGIVKLGYNKGLKKAIKIRNEEGKKLWKKFWLHILTDEQSIIRLPHDLEPYHKPNHWKYDHKGKVGGKRRLAPCYVANHVDDSGTKISKKFYYSDSSDKIVAYIRAKNYLMEVHEKVIPLMEFMGRVPIKRTVGKR